MRCRFIASLVSVVLLASVVQAQPRNARSGAFTGQPFHPMPKQGSTVSVPKTRSTRPQVPTRVTQLQVSGTATPVLKTKTVAGAPSGTSKKTFDLNRKPNGQESFQRPPVVLNKTLPIQTSAKAGGVVRPRPIRGTTVAASKSTSRPNGKTDGKESFQTPLTVADKFTVATPTGGKKDPAAQPREAAGEHIGRHQARTGCERGGHRR
jgi:hypothetical protein